MAVLISGTRRYDSEAEYLIRRLKNVIDRAYQTGRSEGLKEAKKETNKALQLINSAFSDVINGQKLLAEIVPEKAATAPASGRKRAAKGSAKLAITSVLNRTGPWGLTTHEIFEALQKGSVPEVKYNTVRGTLWRMTQDEDVERQGDRWVLKKNPPGSTREGLTTEDIELL